MDKKMEAFILDLMRSHSYLTFATVREDGYPQATSVGYANRDLTRYVCAAKDSQKVRNIKRCDKVSLTIDREYEDWNKIKGLSMGANAEVLTDPNEIKQALDCVAKEFPPAAEIVTPQEVAEVAVIKITPKVISVLDYELGFGRTDLVEV